MDRNIRCHLLNIPAGKVALRKESVDRNTAFLAASASSLASLSARRAWIEIWAWGLHGPGAEVALRKESVDRNRVLALVASLALVALRKESVDRN